MLNLSLPPAYLIWVFCHFQLEESYIIGREREGITGILDASSSNRTSSFCMRERLVDFGQGLLDAEAKGMGLWDRASQENGHAGI